jgi:hypothetical protein
LTTYKVLLITITLSIFNYLNAQFQIGTEIYGENDEDFFGQSLSLSENGKILAISSRNSDINGTDRGYVKVYKNNNGDWEQIGVTLYGKKDYDYFGSCISMSADGKILAVSSVQNNSLLMGNGYVQIFRNIRDTFVADSSVIKGSYYGGQFGVGLSLSPDGDVVAIGASLENGGTIRVFKYINNNWIQFSEKISSKKDFENLGLSVSIDSSNKYLSAVYSWLNPDWSSKGGMRIYNFIDSNWVQIGNDIEGIGSYDKSGHTTSITNNGLYVATSAIFRVKDGKCNYCLSVFKNVNNQWVHEQIDVLDDFFASQSSISFSKDGKVLVVGHSLYDSKTGQVRAYRQVGNNWVQIGDNINGRAKGNLAGYIALSADGTTIAIGSPNDSINGDRKGSVSVFSIHDLTNIDIKINVKKPVILSNPNPDFSIKIYYPDEIKNIKIVDNFGRTLLDNEYIVSDGLIILNPALSIGIYNVVITNSKNISTILKYIQE